MSDRKRKFTNAEFKALKRNSDGDITEDLSMNYIWMTESQLEQLSNDDYSRVDDYREEMSYMMADLEAEFG